ncbi:hypothetical protein H4582DRAFT_2140907 [Lactarius indigo]|nr:hypothetical protein H4582DRAFT_2140907 [Lactarius indigo]
MSIHRNVKSSLSTLRHPIPPGLRIRPAAHLEDASTLGHDCLVTIYKRGVKDELYIHDLQSGKQLKRLAPDHVGTLVAYGRRTQKFFFVWLTGLIPPGIAARYDFSEPNGGRRMGRGRSGARRKSEALQEEGAFFPNKYGTRAKTEPRSPCLLFATRIRVSMVQHPLLLRLELKAGHGAGKSTELKVKEAAGKWSFVAQTIGLKWLGDSKAMV